MFAKDSKGYYWRTARGKWIPVKDMKNDHLLRAIHGMEKRNKKFTKPWYVMADEANKRGILAEARTILPFSVC